MTYFVDVHTHLTHHDFHHDLQRVIARAKEAGLGAIVVNGLEPKSNRQILQLAKEDPVIIPALGLYPSEAVWDLLPEDFPHRGEPFSVEEELQFIREQARLGHAKALGECGLDGFMLEPNTWKAQEQVFERFLEIGKEFQLPVIVHSRKLEARTLDIVANSGHEQVNFHCFCGKSKLALDAASRHQWTFSIPANAHRNEAFQKLMRFLPWENILTETDAPYLSPEKGERNEPRNVVGTIELLAQLKGCDKEEAKSRVWGNFKNLFAF